MPVSSITCTLEQLLKQTVKMTLGCADTMYVLSANSRTFIHLHEVVLYTCLHVCGSDRPPE